MTAESTNPRHDGPAAEPLALRLNDQLGLLLRETVDDLQKARDMMREMGEPDPNVWQYATGLVGMALHKATLLEREQCAGMAENYDLGTPEGHAIAACIRGA